MKVDVSGVESLSRNLQRVNAELDPTMKAFHEHLADELIDRAAPNVPVRKGRLKGTLKGRGTVRDAIGRAGRAGVPYAAPIHWGWRAHHIEPNPFLTRAAAVIERDITDRYDEAMAEMLDQIIGG